MNSNRSWYVDVQMAVYTVSYRTYRSAEYNRPNARLESYTVLQLNCCLFAYAHSPCGLGEQRCWKAQMACHLFQQPCLGPQAFKGQEIHPEGIFSVPFPSMGRIPSATASSALLVLQCSFILKRPAAAHYFCPHKQESPEILKPPSVLSNSSSVSDIYISLGTRCGVPKFHYPSFNVEISLSIIQSPSRCALCLPSHL